MTVNQLTALSGYASARINSLLALADFADSQTVKMSLFIATNKTERAVDIDQTAAIGIRINQYIQQQTRLCQARISALIGTSTDFVKTDLLLDVSQTVSDLIDVSLATHDAFVAAQNYARPYL
jgi:predicted XRE-type DNA-binding protein